MPPETPGQPDQDPPRVSGAPAPDPGSGAAGDSGGRNTRSDGAMAPLAAALPLMIGLLGTSIAPSASSSPSVGGGIPSDPPAVTEAGRFEAGPVTSSDASTGHMNLYFGNLHSHTSYSDGTATPEEAYRHARDQGALDFLAITEHNHASAGDIASNHSLYSGSRSDSLISTAKRLTNNGRFVALYGQEFSTIKSGNHLNVLDAPDVIDVESGRFDRLVDDWLPSHLDTTGKPPLLLLNHPATSKSPNSLEYGRDDFGPDDEWLSHIDGQAQLINIINGPSHSSGSNLQPSRPSEGEYLRYLNMGFHLAPTADQDNHRRTWGTITQARTAVFADELTKSALLDAMRKRHVYASTDRNLRVNTRINGHLFGDVIHTLPSPGDELDLKISLQDDDEKSAEYEVHIFSDQIGGPRLQGNDPTDVVSFSGNQAEFEIEDIRYTGPGQYIFFRIHQFGEHDDGDTVWTAPVWFEETAGGTPTPPADPEPDEPLIDFSGVVASRRSSIFHLSMACRNAQQIKVANRLFGQQARQGRRLHSACPR